LKEFQDAQNTTVHKNVPELEESFNNAIPLNAQKEYLKHDRCNCTRFFMCDVEARKSKYTNDKQESKEEQEEEGADLGLINIRLNVPTGGCPHYLDICCEKIKETIPVVKKMPQPVCGKRNDRGVGFRIVGHKDMESNFGEFGWQTAIIELKEPKTPDGKVLKAFLSGGSLIHKRVVLLAAHSLRK
jgi:hypothetical protein